MNQTLHFTHLFSFSSMYSWSETSGSWTTLTLTGLELCRSLLTSWTLKSWLQISPVTCKKGGLKHVRHIKEKKHQGEIDCGVSYLLNYVWHSIIFLICFCGHRKLQRQTITYRLESHEHTTVTAVDCSHNGKQRWQLFTGFCRTHSFTPDQGHLGGLFGQILSPY